MNKYEKEFSFNGIRYGWRNGKLFKAAQKIGERFYEEAEVKYMEQPRKTGVFRGYRLYGNIRKSVKQLNKMA